MLVTSYIYILVYYARHDAEPHASCLPHLSSGSISCSMFHFLRIRAVREHFLTFSRHHEEAKGTPTNGILHFIDVMSAWVEKPAAHKRPLAFRACRVSAAQQIQRNISHIPDGDGYAF